MHAALERPDIRQYLTACHELFKFLLALQGASTYVPWSQFVHPAFGPPKHFANLVVRDAQHFVYEAWSSSAMTEKYDEDAFSIIGRGDFDGDGVDDLLVRRDFLGFFQDEP